MELPHGIPSHGTFDRVITMRNPLAFEQRFNTWTKALTGNPAGLFVAIDGKTMRRSWKHGWSKTPVHRVSGRASTPQRFVANDLTDWD